MVAEDTRPLGSASPVWASPGASRRRGNKLYSEQLWEGGWERWAWEGGWTTGVTKWTCQVEGWRVVQTRREQVWPRAGAQEGGHGHCHSTYKEGPQGAAKNAEKVLSCHQSRGANPTALWLNPQNPIRPTPKALLGPTFQWFSSSLTRCYNRAFWDPTNSSESL